MASKTSSTSCAAEAASNKKLLVESLLEVLSITDPIPMKQIYYNMIEIQLTTLDSNAAQNPNISHQHSPSSKLSPWHLGMSDRNLHWMRAAQGIQLQRTTLLFHDLGRS